MKSKSLEMDEECDLVIKPKTSLLDLNLKEVWKYILAYNLIRQLICQATERHNLEPRQISFTGAIQTFNAFFSAIFPTAYPCWF